MRVRRSLLGCLALAAIAALVAVSGVVGLTHDAASAAPPPGDRGPTQILDGTAVRTWSGCGHLWELVNDPGHCTHGADSKEELADVGSPPINITGEDWPCVGTGTDGKRLQLLYAYASTNRLPSVRTSLESYARKIQGVVDQSAAKTGGVRLVRMVTTSGSAGCGVSIDAVQVSSAALSDFGTLSSELASKGYQRTDRIYLAWIEGTAYCGIGQYAPDDQPGQSNWNAIGPTYAAVATQCWNYGEPHELMHMLGAVQDSAPHTSGGGHCRDQHDYMCYNDAPGGKTTVNGLGVYLGCPSASAWLFDCNDDDYFNTAPAPGSYLATHWNTANSPFLVTSGGTPATTTTVPSTTTTTVPGTTTTKPPSTSTTTTVPPTPGSPSRFTPLTPARILDTRSGNGAPAGKLGAGQTLALQVTGRGGVPAGASAVVANVTVTDPSGDGFVTAYPCDAGLPNASNLNYVAGQTVPNLVSVRLDGQGRVCLFSTAATNLVVDVAGSYGGSGSSFNPLTPSRILDTRSGNGAPAGKLGAGQTIVLQVTGRGGVPAGATGVVANVTVTEPDSGGYATVYPCDAGLPTASNLNYSAQQTVPNLVAVRLDGQGRACIFSTSATHVVADVAGYYAGSGSLFTPLTPSRILDTRSGNGAPVGKLGAGQTLALQVTGRGGVPGGAAGVVANVTVTDPSAGGYVTAYPCDAGLPNASNLNYVAGQTVPNLVSVRLDGQGRMCLYSLAATNLVVDVAGYHA